MLFEEANQFIQEIKGRFGVVAKLNQPKHGLVIRREQWRSVTAVSCTHIVINAAISIFFFRLAIRVTVVGTLNDRKSGTIIVVVLIIIEYEIFLRLLLLRLTGGSLWILDGSTKCWRDGPKPRKFSVF
jgi:hypothetical protein